MKKIINLDSTLVSPRQTAIYVMYPTAHSTSADGMVVTQASVIGEVAAIGIEEDKDEFGDRGSDPSTQAGLSYGWFWAQTNVRALKSSLILLSSLLP